MNFQYLKDLEEEEEKEKRIFDKIMLIDLNNKKVEILSKFSFNYTPSHNLVKYVIEITPINIKFDYFEDKLRGTLKLMLKQIVPTEKLIYVIIIQDFQERDFKHLEKLYNRISDAYYEKTKKEYNNSVDNFLEE